MKPYEKLGLSEEDVRAMYECMLLTRKVDERFWLLNRAGKIPFVISGQGQEAAQIGASFAMDRTRDWCLPYYRDLGVVLAFGMTPYEVMVNAFARGDDPNSGGRQMPAHWGHAKLRIVTGSSPVTTQVPHAAGVALAGKLRGEKFVTFVSFGEGSSNQGDFHEGMNFAGVHKLPVIFFCENNKYAISVPEKQQLACARVSDRAIGYGMPGVTVDGNDMFAVYEAVKIAHERAMNGEGPSLIEAVCERLTPHSSDDNDKMYRTEEDLAKSKANDCLLKTEQTLLAWNIMTEEEIKEKHAELKEIVQQATKQAEQSAYAPPEHALRYVYEEVEAE
ncbi:MAG: thiamine pyrophosphate-dependent dehydrogenase E1 component subunit alpha [Bacilli bacterium]